MKYEEHEYQAQVVSWFNLQYPMFQGLLYCIPNGQNVGPVAGKRLRRMGLVAGVPDLFLSIARQDKHGLYIEMKSAKGRLMPHQAELHARLREQGYEVMVCKSFDAAQETISNYLNDRHLSYF